MKIIHTILILVILICPSLMKGMEHPLNAALILLDPEKENNTALEGFKNPHINMHPQAGAIHASLTQAAIPRLRAILASQKPLPVNISLFKALPTQLNVTGQIGLYVRKKRAEDESTDCHGHSLACLNPDPFAHPHATYKEVYTSASNNFLFQYASQEGNDIKIWNGKTGACVTDLGKLKEHLQKKYPQALACDPDFPELIIQEICPDNRLAWISGTFKPSGQPLVHASGTYNIKTDQIDYLQLGDKLAQASSSGKSITLFEQASGRTLIVSTAHPAIAFELSQEHDIQDPVVSPCNRFVLGKKLDIDKLVEIHCYNLENNSSFRLTHGDYEDVAFSPSGNKVILDFAERIVVFNLTTKQRYFIITKKADQCYNTIFDPTETKILLWTTKIYDKSPYSLFTFDLAGSQKQRQKFPANTSDPQSDFTFCNNYKYLLLPNSHLIMQPIGLASHLSLRELIGLLILEEQKKNNQPYDQTILSLLKENPVSSIVELITQRYPCPPKRARLSLAIALKQKRTCTKPSVNN